jgi:hypothetical protein
MRVAAAGSRMSLLLLGAVVLAVARGAGAQDPIIRADRSERLKLKFPTDRIGYIST